MTPRPSASSKPGKDVPVNINDAPGLQSPSGTNENLLSLLNSTEGLRRSTHTNIQSADGVSTADEDITSKAMRRAAIRNLDSPPEKGCTKCDAALVFISVDSTAWYTQLLPSISFIPISNASCVRNLSNLGHKLGNSSAECTLSINALKKIEVDRTIVTPPTKQLKKGDMNAG